MLSSRVEDMQFQTDGGDRASERNVGKLRDHLRWRDEGECSGGFKFASRDLILTTGCSDRDDLIVKHECSVADVAKSSMHNNSPRCFRASQCELALGDEE